MKWRLGLDLGTNSTGFSVLELDSNNRPCGLLDLGVRIYADGRDPKTLEPRAVARRLARGARRRRDRLIARKRTLANQLVRDGLFPISLEARQALKKLDPIRLRTDALDRRLEPHELGRALFNIGVRRGFKSNRLTDQTTEKESSPEDKLTQTMKMTALTNEIHNSNCRTLGEYLQSRLDRHLGIRFRSGGFDCYPSREHYLDEFRAIRAVQEPFYPQVGWERIEEIIFRQRPLRKQERGRCQFYTEEDRAYAALPSSQQFRIVSEVNNLRYSDGLGSVISLSDAEKDALFSTLNHCKTLSFGKIRKVLGVDGRFNLEDDKRDKLLGNETAVEMRKPNRFGYRWDSFPIEKQDEIVDTLLEAETDVEVEEYLGSLGCTVDEIHGISTLHIGRATTRLSSRFMRECVSMMTGRHLGYAEAVDAMGLHHSYRRRETLDERLPYYGKAVPGAVLGTHPEADEGNPEYKYGKIGNPTVHIALNQLRKIVNSLIERFGEPSQIVVEVSRDLKNSVVERRRITGEQAKAQVENESIREVLKTTLHVIEPSSWDVKKYKLWVELGKDAMTRRCVYCGKPISANQLFTPAIEIEHILPYSRTMLDSMSNLTVAHKACNQVKKEMSPYEAFGHSPEGFHWEDILVRANSLPSQKHRKFLKNAIDDFTDQNDFIARQLTDNAYLSRTASEYLSCICDQKNIWVTPGRQTSILRAKWGMNTILNSSGDNWTKNRSDHRHHAVDALVIGLTDRGLIKRMADLNSNSLPYEINVPEFPFNREDVLMKLRKMLVSHKMDHGYQSRIFKETAAGLKMVKIPTTLSKLKLEDLENLADESMRRRFEGVDTQARLNRAKALLRIERSESGDPDEPVIEVLSKVWITRVRLVDLDAQDIKNHRLFNKELDRMVSDSTIDVLEDRKLLANRLNELSKELGVKRVRYVPKGQEFTQIRSVPNKWYENDGLHCVVVWAVPRRGKKPVYQGEFINYQKAYDLQSGRLKAIPKPHPAAKRIMTLYKNDVLLIRPENGGSYHVRVAGFASTSNKVDIQPIHSSGTIKEWLEGTNAEVIENYSMWAGAGSGEGHNHKSINVLFSENEIKVLRVLPDCQLK